MNRRFFFASNHVNLENKRSRFSLARQRVRLRRLNTRLSYETTTSYLSYRKTVDANLETSYRTISQLDVR